MSLLKSDLVKETYKVFGFSRGSAAIEKGVMEGIDRAVEKGDVYVDESERMVLKE